VKITPTTIVPAPREAEPTWERSPTGSAQIKKPDRVSLSPETQKLQQAEQERIEALTAEVRGGRYAIDLDAIAEAIVRKEQL
jgi:anti-sigma28 factor (negative regulator of flagellin synthesis)